MILTCNTRVAKKTFQDDTLNLAMSELCAFLARSPGARGAEGGDLAVEFALDAKARGYSVTVKGGRLVFTAPRPVEILYAVYTFAEEILGFCFFEPGHDRVTARQDIALPEGTLIAERVPLLATRGFVQEYPFDESNYRLADWMARNRLNYLLTWMKFYDGIAPEMKKHYQVRGITIESGHHNFDYWVPARKYYRDHPDYFAIAGGRRVTFNAEDEALLLSKQLCASNPAVRREIARNMIAYCRTHPEVTILSLIPNDGFGWCECEGCSRFYDKARKGEFYCVSEHVYRAEKLYHDMVRDIAAQVNQELPGITITFAAYVNYVEPAEGFTLKPGMAVHFAPYWRCINHAIADSACPVNSRYMDALRRWVAAKAGGKVNIYEYYMGVNMYLSLPMVHHETLFQELRDLQAAGADGILSQFHLSHWTAYGLNFYLMAKAAYGEEKGAVEKALRDLFGPDAELARQFYAELRDLVRSAGPCHIPYPRSLIKRTEIEDYERMILLARALLSKKPDDRLRKNLATWMSYCFRFKRTFDRYSEGQDVRGEIAELQAWIRDHAAADIFVPRNTDRYFPKWTEKIERGEPWYHFNIDWEDAYIRRHDEVLNLPKDQWPT